MTEHEKYQEHIRHTHDAFCKTVIRHAAIDAARSIRSRRNKLPPPKSRRTGFCSEQPEIVARQTATPKSVQTKSKGQKSPCLKFLKVLRKLLSRSFLSRVRDRVPRSSPSHVNVFHIFASVIGDELLPRGEVVAEERVEDAVGHSRVGRGDRDQTAGLGIHRRLPHHARLVLA